MATSERTVTTNLGPLFRLGLFVGRHAKVVLAVGLLALIGAAAVGSTAFGKLEAGGFNDPSADSSKVAAIVAAHFAPSPNLVLIVTATDGNIQSAASRAAGATLTQELTDLAGVTVSASYFTTPVAQLQGRDHRTGLILAVAAGSQGTALKKAESITKSFAGSQSAGSQAAETQAAGSQAAETQAAGSQAAGNQGAVTVWVGGTAGINSDINSGVSSSLVKAEAIAVPLTIILLLIVFGSVVSALLPLLIGVFAILGTFFELAVLASFTDVSVFSINLTTALGLGLGIDYGLLMVARFREQLAVGEDVPTAVARTVATAGRTIGFSAAAVVAALSTLTLFPLFFLSSFGYAGIGVVIIAAAAALIITPAAMVLVGHRVEKGRIPFFGRPRNAASPFWAKVAASVFKRPVLTGAPVLIVLLLAGSVLLGIHFALPDQTVLPQDAPSRQVSEIIAQQYPTQNSATITVVSNAPTTQETVNAEAAALTPVPGVVSVAPVTAGADSDGYQRLAVVITSASGSLQAQQMVRSLRSASRPGFLIGGSDAALADTLSAIGKPLPLALGIIVVTTFILLFLFTGSVVQPIRALLVNGISLSAAAGLTAWVFADGHLISLFGATARPMDASMTVLLLCIAFGLSMDYEVFLSSRITELHFAGADLKAAVTSGLARTGRIVTSAALLLAVSFFAFTTSSVSILQLFGFGCGMAVLIDATLVRGVLVPAAMRLLGPANFWAPKPLARLHRKIGISNA